MNSRHAVNSMLIAKPRSLHHRHRCGSSFWPTKNGGFLMVFMMVRDPGILFVIHRLPESIRNPRVFEIIASKNFKHLPGVLSLWAFRAQGLWKVQASKRTNCLSLFFGVLFCNSWCVCFGSLCPKLFEFFFCQFSNFKLWGNDFPSPYFQGNDLVVTAIKNLDPLFWGAIGFFFPIASGLPG